MICCLLAEQICFLPLGKLVGGEGGRVVGGQGDQVVEDSSGLTFYFSIYLLNYIWSVVPFGLTFGSNKIRWSHLTRICLEALDPLISQLSQLSGIVLLVHQVLLVIDRHVPGGGELVVHLLPEAEGPVEGGTVVVAELGAGNLT